MIKHFINISDLKISELRKILNLAKKLKKNQNNYSSLFKNRSLGLIFEKQSARTRISFSIGMQNLSGNIIELDNKQIGFGVRESAEDILKVMSQYLDVLMIRNNDHRKLSYLASLNILPIINGLSDYSHPCQILSDIFTIEESLGKIKSKKITWLGDFNNVLISLIQAAEIFEFNLCILMPANFNNRVKKMFKNKKLKFTNFCNNFDICLKNSEVIMTDAWVSMGEKNIKNKKRLLKKFQVNENVMMKAKKNAIFMHCLPAHRNEEVSNSVIDGSQSVVWRQAQNRMYVQQSILNYLIGDVKK